MPIESIMSKMKYCGSRIPNETSLGCWCKLVRGLPRNIVPKLFVKVSIEIPPINASPASENIISEMYSNADRFDANQDAAINQEL